MDQLACDGFSLAADADGAESNQNSPLSATHFVQHIDDANKCEHMRMCVARGGQSHRLAAVLQDSSNPDQTL